jgi:hypothetical protein
MTLRLELRALRIGPLRLPLPHLVVEIEMRLIG